jgi:superoxide dismutase, Cu-Zn family
MRPRHALALGLALNIAALLPAFAADLKGADGTSHGTVSITSGPKGVLLRIEARGLRPGWHGVHFHEKGDCTGPKFTSAGEHVHAMNPVVHGLLNLQGNDAGDLPNIHAGNDGTATAEFYSTLVSAPALRDADGSAVVVHANPDDYKSQPIGGAGDRVACAVIK